MRIKTKAKTRWHKRFALLPRRIGYTWVWLERYWCRWCPPQYVTLYPHPGFWQYDLTRTIEFSGELVEVAPSP